MGVQTSVKFSPLGWILKQPQVQKGPLKDFRTVFGVIKEVDPISRFLVLVLKELRLNVRVFSQKAEGLLG